MSNRKTIKMYLSFVVMIALVSNWGSYQSFRKENQENFIKVTGSQTGKFIDELFEMNRKVEGEEGS